MRQEQQQLVQPAFAQSSVRRTVDRDFREGFGAICRRLHPQPGSPTLQSMKRSDRRTAPRDGGGVVYTTGIGERCPNCLRAASECVCPRNAPGKPSSDGVVRVSRATQGRKGKGVTVVSGLGLPQAELEKLATELKKRCGSGGSVDNGRIEIQGEHRDRLVEELTRRGWKAKRAGG
jgi:translation initiation factor 1